MWKYLILLIVLVACKQQDSQVQRVEGKCIKSMHKTGYSLWNNADYIIVFEDLDTMLVKHSRYDIWTEWNPK